MRRRILFTIVAVTTLAVIGFFVPTALAMRSTIAHNDLLELQREAAIVASRIPASEPVDLEQLRRVIDRRHDLALYDSAGHLVDGIGPATADAVVGVAIGGVFDEGYVDGDLVAAVPLRPTPTGPGLVVRIREPGSESHGRIVTRLIWLGVAAASIVSVAGAVGWLLARRLSRPIEDLRSRATALGVADASRPAAKTGIAELDDLAAAMTDAGVRIRELLERERSFSSNVSHQLRTPVAALRVAIESELEAPRADRTEVLEESLVALDRLESTVASLLALARHDERQPSLCDFTAVVRGHVEHWSPTFAAIGRDVSIDGTTAIARIDPASVTHIVDVLLDNALQHGRGAVFVSVRANGEDIEVDVADEGSAPATADVFSEQRADASHGIGLRLARTLAESEGGELALVPGARTMFRLRVPAHLSGHNAYLSRAGP